jgi:hypothetical protein
MDDVDMGQGFSPGIGGKFRSDAAGRQGRRGKKGSGTFFQAPFFATAVFVNRVSAEFAKKGS